MRLSLPALAAAIAVSATPLSCIPKRVEAPLAEWNPADRPIRLAVVVPMDQTCLDAVADAITFWVTQGVEFGSVRAFGYDPGIRPGVILVKRGHTNPPVLAVTHLGQRHGEVVGASITLNSCDPRAVAHEFGHALGLDHHPSSHNLMHPTSVGAWQPWGVTEDQVVIARGH